MDAIELLKLQHKEVKKLFKQIEKAEAVEEKASLFEEAARSLVGHDAIEREIFYPACEKAMGLVDILGEALVEHGVVEFCLYEANQALGKADFTFKMRVLAEMVLNHAEEEEEELFPQAEKALSGETLQDLGAEMKARFDEVKSEDFRGPLHQTLTEVLAGTIKPGAQKSNAKINRETAAVPRAHS